MSEIVNSSFPMDIDVQVNVNKVQSIGAGDFSVLCFATPNATFDLGERIRFYRSLNSVLADFAATSEVAIAATAFFAQPARSNLFAVGRIFTSAQAGYLQCGKLASDDYEDLKAYDGGAFGVSINGSTVTQVTGIDFSSITSFADAASVIQTKIRAAGAGTAFTACTVTYSSTENAFRIVSGEAGDGSSVSFLTAPTTGDDYSIVLKGTSDYGYCVDGYTPLDDDSNLVIGNELARIQDAAVASGRFIYGWACDKSYRDTALQTDIADWVEAQTYAVFGAVTNTSDAKDSTASISSYVFGNNYRRTFVVYHNNAYYYPEISILAYMLSVNYAMTDSTVTAKFKTLPGIPTVPLSDSELATLEVRRINTYTLMDGGAKTFREGVMLDNDWYIDDLVNLDNFRNQLQLSVYNVFLRNKKIPYNANGVNLIYSSVQVVCDRFVSNGTLSYRDLSEAEAIEKKADVEPPYTINITPIGAMTVADRQRRVGPPVSIVLNLAGAIHSMTINVDVFN